MSSSLDKINPEFSRMYSFNESSEKKCSASLRLHPWKFLSSCSTLKIIGSRSCESIKIPLRAVEIEGCDTLQKLHTPKGKVLRKSFCKSVSRDKSKKSQPPFGDWDSITSKKRIRLEGAILDIGCFCDCATIHICE